MYKLKVLIIEDEFLVAADLKHLLEEHNCEVIACCKTGEDAIAAFQASEPDIALVDIQIKGALDGIETVTQFNAIRKIPIIFLTAQADSATIQRAKVTLPSAYLLKPFQTQNLLISIELAMNNFYPTSNQQPKVEVASAKDIKLTADVLLKCDNKIFIKQNYRFQKYLIEDLIYLEADKNYTTMIFKQQKIAIRLPLQEVFNRLATFETIVRVNRSFIINIIHVEEFSETEIIVHKNKLIALSPSYKDDFLEKFSII